MKKEIKRNTWAKFLRRFNAANQYRFAEINVIKGKNDKNSIPLKDRPFMGMAMTKKGRFIDGIQLFAANANPENVTEPIVTLKDPEKIILEKDDQGQDRMVTVVSKDGTKADLMLGEHNMSLAAELIRKVAYSIYERRGGQHGQDQDDWFDAERKVKDTELDFVR